MKRIIMKKIFYKITRKYWNLISLEHAKKNNFTVQNGLFKGLQINKDISWGKGDIASKIYGLYENNVQSILKKIKKPILVDIGSADGFFAVGCLYSGLSKFCYAFEQSQKGQEVLLKTAQTNNVIKKISIKGKVTSKNFISLLPIDIDLSKTVIICDIEGEEYNFLNDHILSKCKKANFIVEMHKTNNINDKNKLYKKMCKFFDVSIIIDGNKNYNETPQLHNLNDIDRLLLTCEGRSYIGEWWHLQPIK